MQLLYVAALIVSSRILIYFLGSDRLSPVPIDLMMFLLPIQVVVYLFRNKWTIKQFSIVGVLSIVALLSFDTWRYSKNKLFESYTLTSVENRKVTVLEASRISFFDGCAVYISFENNEEVVNAIVQKNGLSLATSSINMNNLVSCPIWWKRCSKRNDAVVYEFVETGREHIYLFVFNDVTYFTYNTI